MANDKSLILAIAALVLLSFVVLLATAFSRVRFMRRERIHPQRVASRGETTAVLAPLSKFSDNLQNLFEVPVLFYLLVILLLQQAKVETVLVTMAWIYVALRYLHSYIHCTYNKVIHRFYAFVASVAVLMLMWIKSLLLMVG